MDYGSAMLRLGPMVPARKIRSACLRFLPGHWALSMQNLILLRFTDAPGFAEPTVAVRIPTGRSGTGPYEKNATVPVFAVGAGP